MSLSQEKGFVTWFVAQKMVLKLQKKTDNGTIETSFRAKTLVATGLDDNLLEKK